ncbi:hypothetical protein SAMN02910317_01340 [Ruminococcaceae bacterium FB2012]|nr:hypothetical protein SAMN02910317_01340 [Ruminococcaceae bacterium FB2012]
MDIAILMSESITTVPLPAYHYLKGTAEQDTRIILNGTDKASLKFQEILYDLRMENVKIYTSCLCFDSKNLGLWEENVLDESIYMQEEREYYDFDPIEVQDKMLNDAESMFLIWDGESNEFMDVIADFLEKGKKIMLLNDKVRKLTYIMSISDALHALCPHPDRFFF